MTPPLRNLAHWIAAAAVAGFGAVSVASYRPVGITDRSLAVASLKSALAALNDGALDPKERLAAYHDGLTSTEAHLRRAIRLNLVDTASIERLATVRWELGTLGGTADIDSVSALMNIASTRAPRVPEIQADLGALFYKMGRPAEAAPFMMRAVVLSPGLTNRVVEAMLDAGVAPREILRSMSATPDIIIAVRSSFVDSGDGRYLFELVEKRIVDAPEKLLIVYGDVAVALGESDRAKARLLELGILRPVHAEAERQYQLGRLEAQIGMLDLAYDNARSAVSLWPSDPRYYELLGVAALRSGLTRDAELAFRDGLALSARPDGLPQWRARFYRGIGEVAERLGKGDEAFDSFTRACEQDPMEPVAREKLARLAEIIGRAKPPTP